MCNYVCFLDISTDRAVCAALFTGLFTMLLCTNALSNVLMLRTVLQGLRSNAEYSDNTFRRVMFLQHKRASRSSRKLHMCTISLLHNGVGVWVDGWVGRLVERVGRGAGSFVISLHLVSMPV